MENGQRRWINKTKYLENVSGYKIVEEQTKLNTPTSFVVATQVFPFQGKLVKRENAESLHQAYDAFIYYKEAIELEGTPTETVKQNIIEDNDSVEIVLP